MLAADQVAELVTRTGNRVIRPRDLSLRNPALAIQPLLERGVLQRISHGHYLAPPDTARGGRTWRPSVEGVALGVAVADYGRDRTALMGISAARLRGALPRAMATAVVTTPKTYRPDVKSAFGRITFVSRDIARIDFERVRTEVVDGWATTPEQTIIDIAARPALGEVSPVTASEAITGLSLRCDWDLLVQLAGDQRQRAALARASWVAAAVREVAPVEQPRPVPSLGLKPASRIDPAPYGITP